MIGGCLGIALLLATGLCSGQEAMTTKGKKTAKEITATGYQMPAKAAAKEVTVEGFELSPDKDQIDMKRNRILNFKNASKKSEVKINITEDQNWLDLKIESSFDSGTVLVEIIDPEGLKIGTYTVKTDEPVDLGENTTSHEQVSATFGKTFRYPKKGEWVIRALPTAATGWIAIDITQAIRPGLNR